jgi:hypothetical protein
MTFLESFMKSWLSIPAAMLLLMVLGAATSDKLPAEVAAHVKEMNDFCRSSDGKPLPSGTFEPSFDRAKFHPRNLVEYAFLRGPDFEVWAIDEGRFRCDHAASLFSGSGGSQVYVFARLSDGRVRQVFNHGAYGMSLKRIGSLAELSIRVGGTLCGQAGNPSNGEAILCDRQLVWDKSTQKMDFAPLAEAQFQFGKTNGQ